MRAAGWLAVVLTLGSGCATSHAERGRQALARGDHGSAVRELELAVKQHPAKALVWRDLARAHMRRMDPQAAEKAIARAHALTPADPEVLLVRAQVSVAIGQHERAVADAERVLERASSPRTLQEVAVLFVRLHRPEHAIAAAEQAVTRSHDDPSAYANLAVLATHAGRDDVAGAAFDRGRRIHPEHRGLAEAHAAWLIGRGELGLAREIYRHLLHDHPDPGLVHLAIALLSHGLGELDDARVHSAAAVDAVGDARADVHYTHVVVLRDAGARDDAREHLARARRRFPADEELAALAREMNLP